MGTKANCIVAQQYLYSRGWTVNSSFREIEQSFACQAQTAHEAVETEEFVTLSVVLQSGGVESET